MAQRVVQYQAVHQLAQTAPQIYDLPYLHRQMIETLGVKNAEKIVPIEDDMKPVDPVSENMAIITGKPVKAFMYQDHEAHIGVHMAAMQDPKMMAIVGQNPQAQAIQAAGMAHLMEHVAFQYRKEIEKQLGGVLPPPPEDGENHLPPEIEVQLSQLAAQAAARLLQKDQAEAQQQQAQQQAQDPLMQMQMQDLQIKQAEVDRKSKKDMLDAAAKADELRIKEAELLQRGEGDEARMALEIIKQQMQGKSQDELEGSRMMVDLAKHQSQMSNTRQQAQQQTDNDMFKHGAQMRRQDMQQSQQAEKPAPKGKN
jgi:hypothetical protein